MNQDPEFDALRELIWHRHLLVALVQFLVDQKILKGDEEAIFAELTARATDLMNEESAYARANDRARRMIEALSKAPKQ
jgi:hypothetical protein